MKIMKKILKKISNLFNPKPKSEYDLWLAEILKIKHKAKITGIPQFVSHQHIGLRQIRERREEITASWERAGLLDGLVGNIADNIANLFQGQLNWRMPKVRTEDFYTMTFPKVRRPLQTIISYDVVSVSPLGEPIGRLFYLDTIVSNTLPYRIPKITGGTAELYIINLILEWNSFIKRNDDITDYEKTGNRKECLEKFKYLAKKLLQVFPKIREEFEYTLYDYNVLDYLEKKPEHNFKSYLNIKPKEIKFLNGKKGYVSLFGDNDKPYGEVKLGGTLSTNVIFEAPDVYTTR